MIIVLTVLINQFYLYNPFNFPKGNLKIWGYSWYDFRNPIDIECLSWFNGDRAIYIPKQDSKDEARYIINSFANLKELGEYLYEDYIKSLPDYTGKNYSIFVRLSDKKDKKGLPLGNILLPFSFYENHNIVEIDGAYFFVLTEDLKEHIKKTYTEELVFSK